MKLIISALLLVFVNVAKADLEFFCQRGDITVQVLFDHYPEQEDVFVSAKKEAIFMVTNKNVTTKYSNILLKHDGAGNFTVTGQLYVNNQEYTSSIYFDHEGMPFDMNSYVVTYSKERLSDVTNLVIEPNINAQECEF